MTTQTEALKLALEALEWSTSCMSFDDFDDMPEALAELNKLHQAITAIKEALAQPEQEPWLLETTQTLAKHMAREFYPEVTQWECLDNLAGVISQIDNMTTGLMRKPEQEPVAWMSKDADIVYASIQVDGCFHNDHIPLYTTPPQRKPLTREQRIQIVKDNTVQGYHGDYFDAWGIIDDVEAAHGIKD